MTAPSCIACGETLVVQTCPSCGVTLAVGHAREQPEAPRLRDGGARDIAAALRDRGAEARDSLARRRDRERDGEGNADQVLERAAHDREHAAIDRERAADDRARAAADRELAAAERSEALQIRARSAELLARAATDELTGARTRLFGLDEAARELDRARRKGGRVLLAFVDVDGLKHLNDTRGHQAGDALLRGVGEALRTNLRPYDVIVRYGGDEFLCVMPDVEPREARARFAGIALFLTAMDVEHSISFGLAQAWPGETLTTLIARADADLLHVRARATG